MVIQDLTNANKLRLKVCDRRPKMLDLLDESLEIAHKSLFRIAAVLAVNVRHQVPNGLPALRTPNTSAVRLAMSRKSARRIEELVTVDALKLDFWVRRLRHA